MKKCRVGLWSCLVVLAACGPVSVDYARSEQQAPAPEPEVPGEVPEVIVDVPEGPRLESCGPQMQWWTGHEDFFVDPGFFGISPNGGLVVRSGMYGERSAYRVSDGERLFQVRQNLRADSMDGAWRVYSEIDHDQNGAFLAIKSLITQETLRRFNTGLANLQHAVLSDNAERLIAFGCEGEHSALAVHDTMSGESLAVVSLESACGLWGFYPDPPLALSKDNQRLAVGVGITGELLIVDLATGQWSSAAAHPGEPMGLPYGGLVIDVALHPDGELVATSGHDDKVRVWRASTLEQIAEFDSIAAVINEMTYMPSLSAALVSWSPDGTLLAHTNPEGDAVLRKTSDWSELHTIERPIDEEDQPPRFEEHLPNPLIALTWGAGGATLAISAQRGVGMWGCPQPTDQRVGATMTVALDGPRELRVGQAATFVATHFGSDDLHGHAFFIDGEPIGFASTEREIQWTPDRAGDFTLRVLVDNGVERTDTSFSVSVR